MQTAVPLACFLSVIRPPGVQYENSLLQIAPVDKSKCPYVKDGNDVAFQLFTRHNPTVHQDLKVGDDEKLFASNMDFHDKTVVYFHAWMETTEDGSAVMVREAYMQRGDTNVIMVDARSLQAGPWYFTAAQNTWYIGRFAGQFIDYLVTRGLNLNNTHLVGHSLGAQVAGVAGSALKSGKVARITGLDAALPLFDNLPLKQRLDPSDAKFVDTIHTDGGIFGYKAPIGHVDFYPNAGISPQPGCELEVVIPKQLLLNKCDPHRQTNGFYTYYLKDKRVSTFGPDSLEYKLEKLFTFIQAVRAKSSRKDNEVILDKVKANIISLNNFKEGINGYLNYHDRKNNDKQKEISKIDDKDAEDSAEDDYDVVNDDRKIKTAIVDKVKETNIKLDDGSGEVGVEDQIAEESGVNNVEIDEGHIENSKELLLDNEEGIDVKIRKKREVNINKSNDTVELTVESANLTLINDEEINKNKSDVLKYNKTSEVYSIKTNADKKENINKNDNDLRVTKQDSNSPVSNRKNKLKITSNDGKVTEIKKKQNFKPFKFNIFRTIPIIRQVMRIIQRINKKERSKSKEPKFYPQKNTVKDKKGFNLFKIGSKLNPISTIMKPITSIKKNILKRQKRFLPFFQKEEDNNNILFRMLDFLVKNRKNVLPVFTVVREINTLVKSANGELNHFSKESNNYIGATPPVFTPVAYSLELGNENRITAFVKKLFGIVPKGDRLTIAGGK